MFLGSALVTLTTIVVTLLADHIHQPRDREALARAGPTPTI